MELQQETPNETVIPKKMEKLPWHKRHPQQHAENCKRWREANKDLHKQYCDKWVQANKERYNENHRRTQRVYHEKQREMKKQMKE